MQLISREEVLSTKIRIQHDDGTIHEYVPVDHIQKIKPRRKGGDMESYWEKITAPELPDNELFRCHNCGMTRMGDDMLWPYCPICGYDMLSKVKAAS